MRLMAQYVGPAGMVVGLDTDANIGAEAIADLNGAGLRQCRFLHTDLFRAEQIPAPCADSTAGSNPEGAS